MRACAIGLLERLLAGALLAQKANLGWVDTNRLQTEAGWHLAKAVDNSWMDTCRPARSVFEASRR